MGPTALLHLRGKNEDVIRVIVVKDPSSSAGLNPNLGKHDNHYTTDNDLEWANTGFLFKIRCILIAKLQTEAALIQ
jgi:hypothetical protein